MSMQQFTTSALRGTGDDASEREKKKEQIEIEGYSQCACTKLYPHARTYASQPTNQPANPLSFIQVCN